MLQEGPSICGDIVRQLEPQEGIINLQLDIYLKLDDERILVESFGGIGDSREEATNDALRTFSRGTLPVLLAGLYGDTSVRVNRLTWEVAGQERRVTIGNLTRPRPTPGDSQPPREWIAALKEEIAKADLPGEPTGSESTWLSSTTNSPPPRSFWTINRGSEPNDP
ncbi:MAG: DUF6348 family protein [Pirellulaceae bacterium]